jgi:hypothetical protein
MDTTTAVIQFIGIVLFSSQVPNDSGVHAILPRIGHVHQIHGQQTVPTTNDPNKSFVDPGVESHVAILMYHKNDRIPGGWRRDGVLNNGWEYVRLDGERVQFLTNSSNAPPSIPTSLPRAAAAPSCTITQTGLQPQFQSPYRGAIGVIDISAGTLDVCESNTKAVSARVDTRLLIDTLGVLVIVAVKPGQPPKTITLDGDAVVYVANIPPKHVERESLTGRVGDPHWVAYNDMLSGICAAPPETPPDVLEPCDLSGISQAYKRAREKPPADFLLINSECSNSQWP